MTYQDTLAFRSLIRQIADTLAAQYSDKQIKPANYSYAMAYIRAVPSLLDGELHAQGLYIQSNLAWWRGDTAKRYKIMLKNATNAVR